MSMKNYLLARRAGLIAWLWLSVAAVLALFLLLGLRTLIDGSVPADRLYLTAVPTEGAFRAAGVPAIPAATMGLLVSAPAPAAVALLNCAGLVASYAAAIVIAVMMFRLFRELGSAGVFSANNVARLRRSGWLLIGAELIRITTSLAQEFWVRANLTTPGWHMSLQNDRDVHLLFGGLLLLGLAHAFRLASGLRRQAELTI